MLRQAIGACVALALGRLGAGVDVRGPAADDWTRRPYSRWSLSGAVGFSNSGFASVEGDEDYNLALSERRAATVYHFLEDNGIDMNLITPVHGFGETDSMGSELSDNRVVILSFNG